MTPRRITDRNELKKLGIVAKMLETFSNNGHSYNVIDCYFDYGQDWMWTTIIDCDADCQILNPMEWAEILTADSATELAKITEEIRNGEYFQDK